MLSLSDSAPLCRLTWQPKAVARIVNELNTLNKRRYRDAMDGREVERKRKGKGLRSREIQRLISWLSTAYHVEM